MSIALLYDAPMTIRGGRLRIDKGYGICVDALAPYFRQIILCNTAARFDIAEAPYEPRAGNILVQPLPHYARTSHSVPTLLRCAGMMWRASGSWDLLHITLPCPLGVIGYWCARARRIPIVLSVAGDLEAQYERSRYRGISRLAAGATVRAFEAVTQWMVDRAHTIAWGDGLYKKYKRTGNRVVNIPWSPIRDDMIVSREDTCHGAGVRLLFVGALLERKGIFVLLESAKALRQHLRDFTVTYVGAGGMAEELGRRIAEAGLTGHVRLRGGIYDEADLLREYDAADLFVFPTYGEGFPRVIFEAMARGLPVISTRVSGIPGLLENGRDAVLVTPGSPNEVSEAVLRIVRDATLRRRLIRRGREIVHEYTLEETTRKRVEAILGAYSSEWQ